MIGRKQGHVRFAELHDRLEAGEALSAIERAEYEYLAESDWASARELSVMRELGLLLEPHEQALDESERDLVESALAKLAERDKVVTFPPLRDKQLHAGEALLGLPRASAAGSSRRVRTLAYLTAAAALLATLALVSKTVPSLTGSAGSSVRRHEPDPFARDVAPLDQPPPVVSRAELTFAQGEVLINGVPTEVGVAPLPPSALVEVTGGRACLSLGRDLDVCLLHGSRIRLDGGGDGPRTIELEAGWVGAALAKRPESRRFSIRSGAVEATALGTLFAVERHEGDRGETRLEVSVAEGQVKVGGGAATPREGVVSPGEQLVVRDGSFTAPEAIPRPRLSTLFAELNKRSLWRPDSVGVLSVAGHAPSVTVTLDQEQLGRAPFTMLVSSGPHRLVTEDSLTGKAETRQVSVLPGKTTHVDLPRVAGGATTGPSAGTEAGAASPERLLARARQELQAGNHVGAASTYRSLRALYPGSAEAHTVLVTLGQLELDRLGQPKLALQSFETYLRSGGALAQEARRGQIRALRALGASAREREAIRIYLERYPKSLSAAELRRRLEELSP